MLTKFTNGPLLCELQKMLNRVPYLGIYIFFINQSMKITSTMVTIIGLMVISFNQVEPRMFMVPNQWLLDDTKLVHTQKMDQLPNPLKKAPKAAISKPHQLVFPEGKDFFIHNLVHKLEK